MKLTIAFTCNECGLNRHQVKVRPRREGEDIQKWLGNVVNRAIAMQHQIKSFGCESRVISEIWIPTEDEPNWPVGKYTDKLPPLPGEDPCNS